MADGQLGPRAESSPSYTKIFSGFRIALDLKKLALAGVGILLTALGWWVLCWLFYTPAMPLWKNYEGTSTWKTFKHDRARWNLLHLLAAPPNTDPKLLVRVDAADVAHTLDEYKVLDAAVEGRKLVEIEDAKSQLILDDRTFPFKLVNDADVETLKKLGSVPLINVTNLDEKEQTASLGGVSVKIEKDFVLLKQIREAAKPLLALSPASREVFMKYLDRPAVKAAGKLRACPWNEDRGENPYLLVTHVVHGQGTPFPRGGFCAWLVHDQLPVLAEPLVKFLSPIYYLFQSEAGGFRNSCFLILVIFWNLMIWGYFGGCITRLAAIQISRNEKAPLGETLAFVNQRCKHYILAPIFPLLFLFILTFLLGGIGFVQGWTFHFGDIILAGLLWPLVIVLGLIMAVVLVGLLGWPMMYPTISTEGTDSFDALSRSYSYFYHAPWNYLCYAVTALLYGAALVFFVGFMGSLMIYMGKWGFSQGPWLASDIPGKDRTPVYLFSGAPTSFGWRDLLLHDSEWAEAIPANPANVNPGPVHYRLQEKYAQEVTWNNRIGGWLVTGWLGLVFLLILGFGYSYFWTASTIIYFLMRKRVDDTEYDEIHLDEDEVPPPPPKEPTPTPPPAPAAKPNTISLNIVEPPPAHG